MVLDSYYTLSFNKKMIVRAFFYLIVYSSANIKRIFAVQLKMAFKIVCHLTNNLYVI